MNKIKCELCGEEFKRVAIHLKQAHGYTKEQQKEYYDKYLKKNKEGICLECGSPTRFMGINIGYKEFCSDKCIRG